MTDGDHRSRRDPLALVEQAAIVEELQSSLRHELRNKFAAIRNATFYLKRRVGKTELWNTEPRLAEMHQVIDHDLTVASGLLDDADVLTRLRPRAIARQDAAACVQRAAACLRGSQAVRVEVEAQPDELEVDAGELSLAIRNLLENAVEASSDGGIVRARAGREGGQYVIQVTDDGPGIASEERERVFQPFHSTKPGHAGLGLNIARRVALRYAGEIAIEERTSGASLSLRLTLPKGN